MRDHGVTSPAGFVAGVFLALMLILAGHPAARASTGGSGAGPADLPAVLSDADADRYRQIFEMQEDGQWKAADRLIKALEDPILMGHVLAQRYLHATAYRSQYKELKDWMAAYADHPEATRIYKLALRRRPKNWRMPKPPQAARDMGAGLGTGKARTVTVAKGPRPKAPPRKALTKAERAKADAYARKVRHYLRNGWTKSAKRVLNEKEVQALLPQVDYDTLRAHLGHAYFVDGHDDWALQWAGPAAKRSGRWVPQAHWTSGLAAWRLKKFADAASHFEAVAARPDLDPEMRAAGAFWAARTHMIDGRPDKVNPLLLRAAAEKRTFYGLLARKLLGLPIDFAWEPTADAGSAAQHLTRIAAGRRALALAQVGRYARAETELRVLARRADDTTALGLLALAGQGGMPSLAMRLDRALFPGGSGYDGAAYPLPAWQPDGGFRVDRALIYAVIRQESRFNPRARSYAGARGLMQLMPATASFVARDRDLRRGKGRGKLYDPGYNMALGQKYLEMLMAEAAVRGDLFALVAAWNGGPGNLTKWRRTLKHQDDPLLFIECIPAPETRNFIEHVLSNLWIYRDRLGQDQPSLGAIAAGEWPVYTALD